MQREHCSRETPFDFSIIGDELEQHRIQLEHNLQETDLSLHLSSAPGDAGHQDDPSVEYPRHRGSPTPADFPSFSYAPRGPADPDSFSHPQVWSYGTFDDDGIHPFAGETISTAAHHASALTLSAGLAGREAASLSETEYDPERPLHRMIAPSDRPRDGARTRSPRVINGKVKLDRVLQSGHTPRQPTKSPQYTPESNVSGNSRPKLSDTLRHVSFSPKRLRSPPSRQTRRKPFQSLGKFGHVQLPDITNLTSAIESPARLNLQHQQYQAHEFRESDACLISTLNAIQSKLSHLENENSISRRRVRELELELLSCNEKAPDKDRSLPSKRSSPLKTASRGAGGTDDVSQALEDLVITLRAHLNRLTAELSSQHRVLNELQHHRESDGRALKSKFRQVNMLSQEVERLAGEVSVLRGMVEEGLRGGDQAEDERSTEVDEQRSNLSRLGSGEVDMQNRSQPEDDTRSPSRRGHRQTSETSSIDEVRPVDPFPKIRGTRIEKVFFSVPETKPRRKVLRRVVRELEDDFAHYKSIYVELAEEYKHMDATSDPPKRNILARHLHEVIGLLEQRGDQVVSLYDVLKSGDISAITDGRIALL